MVKTVDLFVEFLTLYGSNTVYTFCNTFSSIYLVDAKKKGVAATVYSVPLKSLSF